MHSSFKIFPFFPHRKIERFRKWWWRTLRIIVESNFGMAPFLKSSIPSFMNVQEDARSEDFFSYFPFNLSRYLYCERKRKVSITCKTGHLIFIFGEIEITIIKIINHNSVKFRNNEDSFQPAKTLKSNSGGVNFCCIGVQYAMLI